MTGAGPNLTLAWSNRPGPPPDYTEHDGRRVEWEAWHPAAICSHLPSDCEPCGYTGRAWIATGLVHPLPGETRPVVVVKKGKRSGREYETVEQRPARPVARLAAFRCPACRDLRVYDMHGGQFVQVASTRGTLFTAPHDPMTS